MSRRLRDQCEKYSVAREAVNDRKLYGAMKILFSMPDN
jgi:hypothetical protein